MKKAVRPILLLSLLAAILLLCACGADGTATPTEATVESVTTLTVTADRTELLLDTNTDTRVVYTVITPMDCTEVCVGQRTTSDLFYSDMAMYGGNFVLEKLAVDPDCYVVSINEQAFYPSSADVKEADGGLVWTLPVDFGFSGVYGAGVRATIADGTVLTAVADVNVRYREIDVYNEGLCAALEAYIIRNSTEPFYYVVDLDKSGLDYMHMDIYSWINLSNGTSGHSTFCLPMREDEKLAFQQAIGVEIPNPWDEWQRHSSPVYGETAFVRPYSSNLHTMVDGYTGLSMAAGLPPKGVMLLCSISGEGSECEYIFDSCRAAVCYRHGVAPDAELFPKAAFLYERGVEVLGSILTDGMNDYEKVKAIHDWMLADGRGHERGADYLALSAEEQEAARDCSYGFMKGWGGECMGWSDTFRMLCGMAGVSCSNVSCSANPGGTVASMEILYDHSMNVALLDGEAYYFDVYWDGAGSGYERPPYSNFAMTSLKAGESHTWLASEMWGPPDAVSTRYATDPMTGELTGE